MDNSQKNMPYGVHVVNEGVHYGPGPHPPPYSPPAPNYGPGPVPGAVVVPAPITTPVSVGSNPSPLVCPSCKMQIITRVEHRSSTKTHLMALLLCIVFFPCACLPYCTDSCQNAEHYCPNCGSYIGAYMY